MIAVVNIEGKQFKVEKDAQFLLDKLQGKKGDKVVLDNVTLIENNGKVIIGSPNIKGASVTVSILEQTRDKKVVVFKKKRRKGYRIKTDTNRCLLELKLTAFLQNLLPTKSKNLKLRKQLLRKQLLKKQLLKKQLLKKQLLINLNL